jgi:hypothetical protein
LRIGDVLGDHLDRATQDLSGLGVRAPLFPHGDERRLAPRRQRGQRPVVQLLAFAFDPLRLRVHPRVNALHPLAQIFGVTLRHAPLTPADVDEPPLDHDRDAGLECSFCRPLAFLRRHAVLRLDHSALLWD